MRKAIEKQEADASLSVVNLQRKKRKIGSDLIEQEADASLSVVNLQRKKRKIGSDLIEQTKRNLCEDRKFNEDEDFGKELNGARNLSPVIDICSNQPPIPTEPDDVEILEPGTIRKDNIDNEIADLNNNGECEWNVRKKFSMLKKIYFRISIRERKAREKRKIY